MREIAATQNVAYFSVGEPLNFGAVDVKIAGGKLKEANFLWNTFFVPEND